MAVVPQRDVGVAVFVAVPGPVANPFLGVGQQPAGFFRQYGRPLAAELSDEYRRGMLRIARATSRAEHA